MRSSSRYAATARKALLVTWCITSDGRKHLLHLAMGNKENQACSTEFFRSLLDRGMRAPTTITSDGTPGLIKAITVCFPASIRIRCWLHRLRNIRGKLPERLPARFSRTSTRSATRPPWMRRAAAD